jgi:uncharacterized protein YegP (UPF0339 family)
MIEFYHDRKKKVRWHTKRNGRKTANSGEGYNRRAGAINGACSVFDSLLRAAGVKLRTPLVKCLRASLTFCTDPKNQKAKP